MAMPTKREYCKEGMRICYKIMAHVIDTKNPAPLAPDAAVRMMVFGQAGLAAACRMNIERLTEVGLIPADLGVDLQKRQQALSIDLHKAISAGATLAANDMEDKRKTGLSDAKKKLLH